MRPTHRMTRKAARIIQCITSCQTRIRGVLMRMLRRRVVIGRKVEKHQSYRTSILMELLATETTYVNQLNTLSRVFYNPLKAYFKTMSPMSPSPAPQSSGPASAVSTDQINTIFLNCEDILEHHRVFLSELKKNVIDCWSANALISPTLLRMSEWLSIYIPYCNNFDESKLVLDRCMKNQPLFSNFVKTAEKVSECNKLDLASFLILPIQRIPRYELLIKVRFYS